MNTPVTDDSLDHIAAPLRHLAVAVASLNLDPANARTHDDKNLAAIKGSLARFGQRLPLVVQQQGMIVRAGNGRLLAARGLGWTHVAALVVDESEVEATAYAIADNRSGELAEWDDETLAKLLQSLPEDAFAATGFGDNDLKELLDQLAPGTVDEDEAPPVANEAVTRRGELWLLGEHRLLCGDSTSGEHVARVMNGEKAALIATDPPYLVDYTGDRIIAGKQRGKDWSATYHEIDIEDRDGFFRAVFTNALAVAGPKTAVYCWHAHNRAAALETIWIELGILPHQTVVWVKPAPLIGHMWWLMRHEPCLFGWVKGNLPEHFGDRTGTSVWEMGFDNGKAKPSGNEHPTQKPVEIFAIPMRRHTRPGEVCYEPFSGSGTQIVAAEQLGRRCHAIEIEPVYVDVAVRRWQALTGSDAMLDGGGRSFEEIAAERLGTEKDPGEAGVEGDAA